jgi:transcriptional regulator with XRE-family HTH domain
MNANRSTDPTDLHIARRLRRLRRALGLEAEKLDRAIGEPPGTVERFETVTRRLSAAPLFRLARALDVEVSFFFEGLPDPPVAGGVPLRDPALLAEGTALARAFTRVADARTRKDFSLLVKSIADGDMDWS